MRDLEAAVAELQIPGMLRDLVVLELAHRQYPDAIAHQDSQAADTIVDVRVDSVMLRGEGINPKLRLEVPATMRILKGGVETRTASLTVGGPGHRFRRWVRDDAQEFRKQVKVELQDLARKIADDLLSRPRK